MIGDVIWSLGTRYDIIMQNTQCCKQKDARITFTMEINAKHHLLVGTVSVNYCQGWPE